ncbi:MAG: alpha/beta hydrolase [Acidobacteriota bacterium]
MIKTLFVHGAPNGPEIWNPLVEALQLDPAEVVALALPGFSAPIPTGFEPSRDAYVDWLLSRLETISEDGRHPVRIVGHDFGTIFTLRACSLRPDLVTSWVAFSSLIDSQTKRHAMARLFHTPWIGELLAKWITNRRLVAKGLQKQGLPEEIAQREAAAISPEMCRCVLALYRTPTVSNVPHPWEADLANLPSKGLMVWGSDDPYVPVESARRFAARWGVPLHVENGAGHWVYVQKPDAVAERLRAFWSTSAS